MTVNWPAAMSLAIVAAMITVLILTGHANNVTLATTALGGVAIMIAGAFRRAQIDSGAANESSIRKMFQRKPPSNGSP
jgi:hypothetical protein